MTKRGVLFGMAMTERQGGSDVRANTTRAERAGGDGEYVITGHKWFVSAPMCDAFLVLAQAPGGLSCFLLPRVLPDGTRNGFHIQRLKDKLGNRSNASSEVEFDHAWARIVGLEGKGVRTIIDMVNHTRLDCVIGSASLMRQAVAQATHHAAHRKAFGKLLSEQPLMVNVLADLAIESEATTVLMMRLARAFDGEPALRRIALAVSKYWCCKRAIAVVAEALECHGGNGYVEESILPRLYREAPLNSIWEGSGNVNALDVLRAVAREPQSVEAFFAELNTTRGESRRLDQIVQTLEHELHDPSEAEARARRVVEAMAIALECSLLLRHGDPKVAEVFCQARLGGAGHQFGTLPPSAHLSGIVARHSPLNLGEG
jgi:putative acyl-CoA dehydrogenase